MVLYYKYNEKCGGGIGSKILLWFLIWGLSYLSSWQFHCSTGFLLLTTLALSLSRSGYFRQSNILLLCFFLYCITRNWRKKNLPIALPWQQTTNCGIWPTLIQCHYFNNNLKGQIITNKIQFKSKKCNLKCNIRCHCFAFIIYFAKNSILNGKYFSRNCENVDSNWMDGRNILIYYQNSIISPKIFPFLIKIEFLLSSICRKITFSIFHIFFLIFDYCVQFYFPALRLYESNNIAPRVGFSTNSIQFTNL